MELHGTPRKVHGISWSFMEVSWNICGVPWKLTEFHYVTHNSLKIKE